MVNFLKTKKELIDKACFQYDMSYGRYKDLKKKKKNTESDKEMKEMKPLKLLVIQNMMDKRRISFNDLQVF